MSANAYHDTELTDMTSLDAEREELRDLLRSSAPAWQHLAASTTCNLSPATDFAVVRPAIEHGDENLASRTGTAMTRGGVDVLSAIEQSHADLANTREELRFAEELVNALRADTRKLEIELIGLQSYARRQGMTRQPEVSNHGDVLPLSVEVARQRDEAEIGFVGIERSAAILKVLQEAHVGLTRSEIQEWLSSLGRYDTVEEVSLALSGLKRSGRVSNGSDGRWACRAERESSA